MENFKNSSIEELRNLIFGEELAAYQDKLTLLAKQMENIQLQTSLKIDEVKIQLFKSIEASEKQLLEKITEIEENFHIQIEKLSQNYINKEAFGGLLGTLANTLNT